jgi:hypothetical protein
MGGAGVGAGAGAGGPGTPSGHHHRRESVGGDESAGSPAVPFKGTASVEERVLQSNPILEVGGRVVGRGRARRGEARRWRRLRLGKHKLLLRSVHV